MSAVRGSERSPTRELIPTVVGYAKEDVLNGILPGDATVLFGRLAQKHRRSLNLVRPLKGGVIADADSARAFAVHLRDILQPEGREVRAVVGLPASSDVQARESARTAFRGVFHKIIFVPEPFLAAIGYRDDARISDVNYRDPVLNSLYIDIGAGSTDVCLVQGHYPKPEDQLSVPFAGDAVDQIIHELVLAEYPESGLTLTQATEFKERYSWVLAKAAAPAVVTVMVGGKPRQIDITAQVGAGCDTLLQKVFELTRDLISRAAPETVTELLQNVIVTGGGSLIKGFGEALQAKLKKEGFENPTVQVLGQNFKDYVALGALKLARRARDNQWQTLIG
jgi:rod shape-determining protein MreB